LIHSTLRSNSPSPQLPPLATLFSRTPTTHLYFSAFIYFFSSGFKGGDGTFVLDAEVVAWDTVKKKLLPFQVLSTRKRKADDAEEQAVQVIVQGFDLIYLHGESLLRKPLVQRRAMMHAAFKEVRRRRRC
jgi:ATP-dependent DNA ligase